MAEYWDIYDSDRNPTGRLHKRGIRLKKGDYHIISEAWLVSGGKLLVTRRHPDKNFGGLWECTGGAVKAGENSLEAVKREIKEEIGIDAGDNELTLMGTAKGSTFFIDCYKFEKNIKLSDIHLQAEEVSDARFVTLDEFMQMYNEKKLIPHMYEYMRTFGFDFVCKNMI